MDHQLIEAVAADAQNISERAKWEAAIYIERRRGTTFFTPTEEEEEEEESTWLASYYNFKRILP